MSCVFSIVVLVYNNSIYLRECLNSIFRQEYPKIEIIVADDGSSKFDQLEIEKYIELNKGCNIISYLVYRNEYNVGTVKNANSALHKSSGRYIKILAADDALYDEYSLKNAANALYQSEFGIITSDVIKCDENLVPIKKYRKSLQTRINKITSLECFKRLCVHNDILAGGVFFLDEFFNKYGYFDESYYLMEDWPTWLNFTKKGGRFFYAPFYAIRYRSNGGIGTSNNSKYISDKKRVLNEYIIQSKGLLGKYWYVLARTSFWIINSHYIRNIYEFLYRKGKRI